MKPFLAYFTLLLCPLGGLTVRAAKAPNFLIIYADDLGFMRQSDAFEPVLRKALELKKH